MTRAILLVLLLLVSGVQASPDDAHLREVTRVMRESVAYTSQKYPVRCYGHGGRFMHDVKGIELCFASPERSSIEEARSTLLGIHAILTKKVNEDLELRPYLHEYPFPSKGINVTLSFLDRAGSHRDDGYIANAYIEEGRVFYSRKDKEADCLVTVHSESLAEALLRQGGPPCCAERNPGVR